MCSSASRSRCPVETPGLSSRSTIARTSATTCPARRMRAISARDLRVTMSGVRRLRLAGHDGMEITRDVVDRLQAVDRTQLAGARVVVDDLAKARELQVEPGLDRVGLVVLTLD